jgi:AraC-like DNA-binding protein
VGGPRTTPYFKDVSAPATSVGAHLRPGASELLFGVPAVELAGSHHPLDTVWGRAASELHERLMHAVSADHRLDVLEQALAALLPRTRGLHPAVAHALERFEAGSGVGEVVRQTGYSHRRFIDLFRHSVGFGPKLFCRVRRFHRAFNRLSDGPVPASGVAFETGYSDQAHFIRDFRDFAGITPGEYRRVEPARPGHVPSR